MHYLTCLRSSYARILLVLSFLSTGLGLLCAAPAAEQDFDIPAGAAEVSLKVFSRQSHEEVLFATDIAARVETNAVKGRFTPLEAIQQMLAGTALNVTLNENTQALVVGVNHPSPGTMAVAQETTAADQPVHLDPFEVQESSDKSYGALNSNSITAFKTELAKMPVSADVFDQAFLDDSNMTTVEQTIQFFSAGAGNYSSAADTSASNSQYLDRNANGSLSLRGLTAPTLMINGFFPASDNGTGVTGVGVTSTFDLEKVEVINGPQALLYGVSGAGGVVNLTTKQARLGAPAFGSIKFQIDQYGNRLGQLDDGIGNDRVAVRVALINQHLGGPRLFIGGPMTGAYVQLAVRPVKNTVIRLTYDDQRFDRISSSGAVVLTALSTANDARNGQYLNWLLATNQLGAAANGGASGAGVLPGITWQSINSFNGAYEGEYRHHHLYTMTADTTWNSWLTTQISVGYLKDADEAVSGGAISYDAANVAANPTGTVAAVLNGGASSELLDPDRQKVARFAVVADNKFFQGRIHSQTILGADTTRSDNAVITANYVQADSNFNPVLLATTSKNGYQVLPSLYWGVPNGPVLQALYNPQSPEINVGGVNYVRAITNITNPALISPGNQQGLTGTGTGDFRHAASIQKGFYAANYSDFFDGRISTLLGGRIGDIYARSNKEGTAASPSNLTEGGEDFTAFNAGLNVKVTNDLRAYAELSDDFYPEIAQNTVLGEQSKVSHGVGEEAGLKATVPRWNLSGQLAIYHSTSQNELMSFTSTILIDINPSGLNGEYNTGSTKTFVNRETQGAQLTATASPGNWRFRISAASVKATVQNNSSYGQLYNDQFNENSSGAITYADGTPVYVAPTYNSKGVIAAPQSTAPAGYIPLTVALLNNPSSPYYANPAPINSQIPNNTVVATVLQQVDLTHGAILTGKTGLPISMLQIAPNPTAPPPGTIVVTQAGDSVSGFPRYSMNFFGVYTVSQGPLKGVRLGGSMSVGWKTSMYYYYPLGVAQLNNRVMLYEPTEAVFTGLLGYEHKFRRITFSTQLNINNLFNHYRVIYLPSSFNGWSGPDNATLDQQPRNFVWSSTLSF